MSTKVKCIGMRITPNEFDSLNVRNWGMPTGGHIGRMWKTEVLWRGDRERIAGYTITRMEPHSDPTKLMICRYFPILDRSAPRRQRGYKELCNLDYAEACRNLHGQ